MPDKQWKLEIGNVELKEDQLVVNSLINYKDLEKKYKDLIKNLNNENQNTLKNTFEKKRIREEKITFLNKDELVEFFNRIAIREGIEVGEPIAATAAVHESIDIEVPTATPITTDGQESSYNFRKKISKQKKFLKYSVMGYSFLFFIIILVIFFIIISA